MNRLLIFQILISCVFFATGQTLNLMPVPRTMEIADGRFSIDSEFEIKIEGNPDDRLYAEIGRFVQRLSNQSGIFFQKVYYEKGQISQDGQFVIKVDRPGKLVLGENESYELSVEPHRIQLTAITDLGALHGLETLLQLMVSNDEGNHFPSITIIDEPRFPWRGLMIDVARHFQPVNVVKRNIDGLAAVKMNVLHLHLSDDQGFRIESKKFPRLTQEASDGFYFTQEQIKDIVQYADQRGIRVYPEFDLPGHASAFLKVFPELGSKEGTYELVRDAGIFDPTLDPTNPETYEFLFELFSEMSALFPDEYFHIGGDENEGKHWNQNESIQSFMKKNKIQDNHELQAYFNNKLLIHLTSLNKKMVGWDEIIHDKLPTSAIIQSWRGLDNMKLAAKKGYQTMLSNGYYIDLMHSVEKHYPVDPLPATIDLNEDAKKNIIGGEATMWSELVTPLTIDSRIWPRTAAIAERLWSSANVTDIDDLHRRLDFMTNHLEGVGLTHITSREIVLRNLSNGSNTRSLRTLADVCQPLQGYTRNPGGTMYKSFSPFTLFADACIADPPAARIFNEAVESYLAGNKAEKNTILLHLDQWEKNHSEIENMAKTRPMIKEILQISSNLSKISSLGKEAVNLIENDSKANEDWRKQGLQLLASAKEQGGRTELKIVDAIELLVEFTTD